MDIQSIFEKPFNMDDYLEKRLLEIEDLDERSFARSFLKDCILQIFNESENAYKRLEDRVFQEIRSQDDKYSIHITVVNRSEYDITHGTWFPVLENDEKKKTYTASNSIDEAFQVGTVFLSLSLPQCSEYDENRSFSGTVRTESGEYSASFQLVPNEYYRRAVEDIYLLFESNSIPWTTVSCGYLLRFFNIQARFIDSAPRTEENIIGCTIDFGELSEDIHEDYIPIWNVRRQEYDSPSFAIPAIDTKYYEHEFPVSKFGKDNGFVIQMDQDIVSLRRTEDEIFIITTGETIQKGIVYIVDNDTDNLPHSAVFPVMHNKRRDSFTHRFTAEHAGFLQTKAELMRHVLQFDTMELAKLMDITVLCEHERIFYDDYLTMMNVASDSEDNSYLSLTNLNWFISDEMLNHAEQKVLLFTFAEKEPDHPLTLDCISFLISQAQRDLNEYRCEAILQRREDIT